MECSCFHAITLPYSSLHESLDVTCCWELFCSNYLVTIQGLPFDLSRRSCRLNFSHFRSGWKLKFPRITRYQTSLALEVTLQLELGPGSSILGLLVHLAKYLIQVQSLEGTLKWTSAFTGLQKREVCLPCSGISLTACFSCLQSKL